MADTTREKAERAAEQAFFRAEDTLGNVVDNNRKTLQSMMEFNRQTIDSSYEVVRVFQEETLRLTQVWFDQVSHFQKAYIKSVQSYTSQVHDLGEKTMRESQERMGENLEQGLELVSPLRAAAKARR